MALGERIRERREALELSQEELGISLGYKNRSTIAKIENGINNLNQKKIQAFADQLETTPAYLLGLTDDPYDYDKDPDSRFDSIPLLQLEYLKGYHNDNLKAVWDAWVQMQEQDFEYVDTCTPVRIEKKSRSRADSAAFRSNLNRRVAEALQRPDIGRLLAIAEKATPEQVEAAIAMLTTLCGPSPIADAQLKKLEDRKENKI